MIIKFRNPDDRIHEIHKNLGDCFQFYPLYVDKRKNFYGLIFVPKESDKDIQRLFSSNFFEILDFINENVLFFKSKYMLRFYPSEDRMMKPFILKNGFAYFFTTKDEKWNVYLPAGYLNELDFKCRSFHDNFTNDLNLLGTLVMSAKYLDKREKESLISAVNFGYPVSDLVDFQKRKVTSYKDEIFQEWKDRLPFYFGDAEKNFVKLLQRSTEKFIRNNRELFERISLCVCDNNSSFTAKFFLKLLEIIPTTEEIYLEKSMPRLFINELMIEGILTIEKEKINDLKKNISLFLGNYPIKESFISEWKDEDLPSSIKRCRFSFLWNTSSERVTISEFMDYAEELKEMVLAALRKTSKDMYTQFSRKRQKFWIRSLEVSLHLPAVFSDTASRIIREYFAIFLHRQEKKRLIQKKLINNEFCLLQFRLRYPMFHDYQISKRKLGYFFEIRAIDKFTRQGIESAHKHLFSKSLILLERGSHAITGDILVWRSKLAKGRNKSQYLRGAKRHYQLAGLPLRSKNGKSSTGKREFLRSLIDFSSDLASDIGYILNRINISIGRLEKPIYLPHMDLQKLLIVQQDNYDWRIAVESYLIGKNMKNEALMDYPSHDEENEEKIKLANTYLAYSSLHAKDSVCLVEDLGVFYTRLVEEIQKEFGDLTAEWLGFDF
ncbi:MAG: hypothetical protein HXS48_16545 [Theionarchaea archaeon]|nr:hypothetical protein [Theionarchaea archaeon]